jgi:hypothetical protein
VHVRSHFWTAFVLRVFYLVLLRASELILFHAHAGPAPPLSLPSPDSIGTQEFHGH